MASKIKIASVIILDVGESVARISENNESFFENALHCASRIISRKIFARNGDEVTLVSIGSEETNNELAVSKEGLYRNINVLLPLQLASWNLYDKVQELKTTTIKISDWFQGLIVSLNILKEETLGKKITEKQVILFSNFLSSLEVDDTQIETLVNVFSNQNVKLIIIGLDVHEESQKQESDLSPGSLPVLIKIIERYPNHSILKFEEALDKVLYFEKKRTSPRALHIDLTIGNSLSVPVLWMKFNKAEDKILAKRVMNDKNRDVSGGSSKVDDTDSSKVEVGISSKDEVGISSKVEVGISSKVEETYNEVPSPPKLSFIIDDSKTTYFGSTRVNLCYADLEAMKRVSGPASFSLIGCVSRKRINPLMYVADNIYVVLPKPRDCRSQTMLSSFVDALLKANKLGIARRILTKNGIVNIGALIPVSDELGKHLYFLKLPFKEWFTSLYPTPVPKTDDPSKINAVDQFIDAMMLPKDLVEEDKGVLVYNPSFQYQCHNLEQLFTNKNKNEKKLPNYISKLLDPVPQLKLSAKEPLEIINKLFPIPKEVEKRKKQRYRLNIFGEVNDDNVPSTSGVDPTEIEDIFSQDTQNMSKLNEVAEAISEKRVKQSNDISTLELIEGLE